MSLAGHNHMPHLDLEDQMTAFHNDLLDPSPADLLGSQLPDFAGDTDVDTDVTADLERQEDFDDYRGV